MRFWCRYLHIRLCARRFRPHPSRARHLPHPGEGFFRLCKFCYILLLNPAYKSALYLSNTNCRSSLPPGGEGVAPATDEGETGERTHAGNPAQTSPWGKRNCKRIFLKKRNTRTFARVFWWEMVDSDHRSQRQQIYSLPPLATREISHGKSSRGCELIGAGDRSRTNNLLITNQLLCH